MAPRKKKEEITDEVQKAKSLSSQYKGADSVLDRFSKRQHMYEDQSEADIQSAEYMRSGCLPYDLVTAGKGLPRGRAELLYSPWGTGKSTLLFEASRGFCQNGYKVLYVDVESSDDTANQMGLIGPELKLKVPKGTFRYVMADSYKELEIISEAFLKSDYDIMMLDSITAVNASRSVREARLLKGKSIEDSQSIGAAARIQSQWVKDIYTDIKGGRKSLIYIAQERNRIDLKNPNMNGPVPAASNAGKFYNNVQIKMQPSTLIKEGVRVIGRQAFLIAEKCRHADNFVKIPTTVFFGRGVSSIELIKKLGSWDEIGIFSPHGAKWGVELPGQAIEFVNGNNGLNEWIKAHYIEMMNLFYDNATDFLAYLGSGGKKGAVDETMSAARVLFSPVRDDGLTDVEDSGTDNEVTEDEVNSELGGLEEGEE